MRKIMVRTIIPAQKKRNPTFYLDDVANKLFEIKLTCIPILLLVGGVASMSLSRLKISGLVYQLILQIHLLMLQELGCSDLSAK